jgi:hypothetical protein
MSSAACGGAPSAAELRRLVAQCASASCEDAASAARAITMHVGSGAVTAAVEAGAPRALARLLSRNGAPVEALEAALGAALQLCRAAAGAEAFVAAGGLPPAVALLRSASPAVNSTAVMALLGFVKRSDAARRRLAADTDAVAALAALMAQPPAHDNPFVPARPLTACLLLGNLAAAALRGHSGFPTRTPVSAAIVRAGGVALAVGVLRRGLEGSGGGGGGDAATALSPDQHISLFYGLNAFCADDEGALRAARDAGALPLAVRSLVEARKDLDRDRVAALITIGTYLHDLTTVSPADDVPALASQPALLAALAAALGLAASAGPGGAAEGRGSLEQLHCLAQRVLDILLQLLDDEPSSHVAASSFARAGGASHLVRAPASKVWRCLLRAWRGAQYRRLLMWSGKAGKARMPPANPVRAPATPPARSRCCAAPCPTRRSTTSSRPSPACCRVSRPAGRWPPRARRLRSKPCWPPGQTAVRALPHGPRSRALLPMFSRRSGSRRPVTRGRLPTPTIRSARSAASALRACPAAGRSSVALAAVAPSAGAARSASGRAGWGATGRCAGSGRRRPRRRRRWPRQGLDALLTAWRAKWLHRGLRP